MLDLSPYRWILGVLDTSRPGMSFGLSSDHSLGSRPDILTVRRMDRKDFAECLTVLLIALLRYAAL